MIGFYGRGNGGGYPSELGNDWPGWFVPIPIHTKSAHEDHINRPPCKRSNELQELIGQTKEYKEKLTKYKVKIN